jgi:hypothetical protein
VYDAIAIEKRNTPTATLVNTGFVTDSRSASRLQGVPALRTVSETVPCECSVQEEIEENVLKAMDAVVGALTVPLTEQEKHPVQNRTDSARIIFSGDNAEINRFFYRRGWGDGLPLVPPTEVAVAEMLQGTDLAPDYVVGKLEPRFGKATVEKIAVNAVMAGALSIHLPVIIAAVKGLADKASGFGTYGCSTGSWSPHTVVNGPIRDEIHINYGSGALSPGTIANAAVGRAISLIAKNIAGARKGIEDMGVQGNPAKYSQVMGEDEAGSPWEPEHVERGFDPSENTVTLFYPNCYNQLWPYGTDDKGILSGIIYNLTPGRSNGLTLIVLTPLQAHTLSRAGWDKEKIRTFISLNASTPAYRHPSFYGTNIGAENKALKPLNAMDHVLLMRNKQNLRIVVAGGPGNFIGLHTSSGLLGDFVTHRIELPENWKKLIQKYKNLVPKYEI